jgi:hypothetical protein
MDGRREWLCWGCTGFDGFVVAMLRVVFSLATLRRVQTSNANENNGVMAGVIVTAPKLKAMGAAAGA